jgi:hypothetical protein
VSLSISWRQRRYVDRKFAEYSREGLNVIHCIRTVVIQYSESATCNSNPCGIVQSEEQRIADSSAQCTCTSGSDKQQEKKQKKGGRVRSQTAMKAKPWTEDR